MKVFCISYQRTGTTSVGRFFSDHGLKVATYKVNRNNGWTESWFRGDYEAIFRSDDFGIYDIFEDDPWWCLEFYKFLFYRFPDALFVHFQRDADRWFESMIRHSNGATCAIRTCILACFGESTISRLFLLPPRSLRAIQIKLTCCFP